MRILYCTDTYPPQVNGVSVVTAASVAGMQDRGWECAVINPRYPKPYGAAFLSDAPGLAAISIHEKIPSASFPPYPDIRLAAPLYGRVRDVARRFQPDVVHCQTEFVLGRLGQRAAAELGVPLVSSYHTDFSRYTESYRLSWLRPRVTRYIARFHARCERVYTPSEPARDDLHRMGIENVEVWGRGVDDTQFHPAHRDERMRAGLAESSTFLFLHVGRLAAEKNVELILSAFAGFRASHPDIPARLVVAGAGPSLPALRASAPRDVVFLGNLDRHRVLPALYASADAFVFASETETLGLVVLEAMASGLPVIAAPAGGVADNLRDGENGLAFRPGDAPAMAQCMARIATDQTLREALSAGALRWARRRSWSSELDRLDQSYREVVEGEPAHVVISHG